MHCSVKLSVITANQNEQLEKAPLFHSLQLIALRVVLIEWRLHVRVSSVKHSSVECSFSLGTFSALSMPIGGHKSKHLMNCV